MERFPKLFIIAAIGYLLAGVALGLFTATLASDPASIRFIHVHLNLLGFMAMFIYGVAYHILPRFNAQPLKYPSLMKVHFYFVNIGLIGMCGFAHHNGIYGTGITHTGFVISAIIESIGIAIFAYNVLPVLTFPKEEKEEAVSKEVTAEMFVSETLEKWPGLLAIFEETGFKSLTNEAARNSFAKAVKISQACKLHRVDADNFVNKLNQAIRSGITQSPVAAKPEEPAKSATEAMAKGKKISRGEPAVSDTLIGSLLEVYPETKPVFEKHYGSGCFSCPGQAFETIAQTAGMHGIKTEDILGEINEAIEKNSG